MENVGRLTGGLAHDFNALLGVMTGALDMMLRQADDPARVRRLGQAALAAGLLWGLWLGPEGFGVKVFFLACIGVAGVYGAATASRKILFIQAVPAALGLLALFLSR